MADITSESATLIRAERGCWATMFQKTIHALKHGARVLFEALFELADEDRLLSE